MTPKLGVSETSSRPVRPGLRSFAATPHVVFYRVVNETPEIVRVLDGRQDIEERFTTQDGE